MTRYRFSNNATTTLTGAATVGATSISVASASAFPSSGDFTIIVDSEIMLVTGVAGTIFTVARAQEGTPAAAHNSGAVVSHVLTATALSSGLVLPATSFPASPASGDRVFRSDRNLEYVYDGTRWLTTQLFAVSMGQGTTAVTTNELLRATNSHATGFAMFIEDVSIAAYVATTNNASNFWSLKLTAQEGNVFTELGVAASTAANGPNSWQSYAISNMNHAGDTAVEAYTLRASSTGAPGQISVSAVLYYRLIG